MSDAALAALLEFAVETARRAGEVTLEHFGRPVEVERKRDRSPVTVADREAEALVRETVGARFPADGILGEEHGEIRPGAHRRWIVDPIDGTRSFVHGVPLYAVLLALEEAGESLLGVIHLPALGETVAAARGLGCHWNGARTRVSTVDRIEDATILATDFRRLDADAHPERWPALRERAENVRTWGDAYGYALVATGRAEAMLDAEVSIWDTAPLLPVVEEAGGCFTDWSGRRGHEVPNAVATNASLAEVIREALASPASARRTEERTGVGRKSAGEAAGARRGEARS